jgi:hypothetical protein
MGSAPTDSPIALPRARRPLDATAVIGAGAVFMGRRSRVIAAFAFHWSIVPVVDIVRRIDTR